LDAAERDTGLSFDARRRGVNVGAFREDPYPENGIYRMYHGTTVEAAVKIVAEGFRAPDFGEIISRVAAEAGLSEGAIRESLARGSFAHSRREFDERRVFFTDSPLWAVGWATWGGEALMETWCAVYRIRNPHVSPVTNEAHDWAVAKLAASPAIIAFDLPFAALESAGNRGLVPNEILGPDRHTIRTVSLAIPASEAVLVSWHPVERGWTWDEVRSKFGLWRASPDDLIQEGTLPPPDDKNFADINWWDSTLRPYWSALSKSSTDRKEGGTPSQDL
jgi:hypothetical protein